MAAAYAYNVRHTRILLIMTEDQAVAQAAQYEENSDDIIDLSQALDAE